MEIMKINDLFLLKAFVEANQAQSFSKAASQLNVAPSVISKKISQLEKLLNITLFQRTTRIITLTQEGQQLLPVAEAILSQLSDMEAFSDQYSQPSSMGGILRISTTETYAKSRITKLIPLFLKKYPNIQLDLILTNNILNLIEQNIDLSIRVYKPTDSTLKAVKLEDNELIFCASPAYIKKHKKISNLTHLKEHPLLYLESHANHRLKNSGQLLKKISKYRPIKVNSGEIINQLCVEGVGIAVRSRWNVGELINDGKLVELKIEDSIISSTAVYALYPNNQYIPKKTRHFLDFIKQHKISPEAL